MMSDLWKSDVNWFATWFDTPAYHALYGERDEDEAIHFIQVLTAKVLGEDCRKVLDMGCGAGRHTAAFAAQGFCAVGLDLSSNSIVAARSKHGQSNRLQFVQGDMRSLTNYVEEGSFDAVASLFTSIGYFEKSEDLNKTLKGVVKILRPNGVFILDFLNPAQVLRGLVEKEVKKSDGYTFTIHRRVTNGWIEKSIQYADLDGTHRHHVERVRALAPEDWRNHLSMNGMHVVAHYGDYALNPWRAESSRSILVARKIPCG